jgi:hypothetical protein
LKRFSKEKYIYMKFTTKGYNLGQPIMITKKNLSIEMQYRKIQNSVIFRKFVKKHGPPSSPL